MALTTQHKKFVQKSGLKRDPDVEVCVFCPILYSQNLKAIIIYDHIHISKYKKVNLFLKTVGTT